MERERNRRRERYPSGTAKKKTAPDPIWDCTLFRCKAAAVVLAACMVLTKTGHPLAGQVSGLYHSLLYAPLEQSRTVWRQAAAQAGLFDLLDNMEQSLMVFAQAETEEPLPSGGQLPWSGGLPDGVTGLRPVLSAPAAAPAHGTLSCGFGPRLHPITGEPDFHTGIDIAAPGGSGVYAAWPGVVLECGSSAVYGNYITVDHGGGLVTAYCHCRSLLAQEGTHLRAGERIATVGSTGISTGNHLHFEVRLDGLSADPLAAFSL